MIWKQKKKQKNPLTHSVSRNICNDCDHLSDRLRQGYLGGKATQKSSFAEFCS